VYLLEQQVPGLAKKNISWRVGIFLIKSIAIFPFKIRLIAGFRAVASSNNNSLTTAKNAQNKSRNARFKNLQNSYKILNKSTGVDQEYVYFMGP